MKPTTLPGGLSPEQYQWLKARLGTSSDRQALLKTGLSKDRLRNWRRSDSFRAVHDAVAHDPLGAFRMLSTSLAEAALDALEWLLHSPKGSDKRSGLDMWAKIFQLGQPDARLEENVPQQIFNILNVRGDVPQQVLDRVNPMRLPAPRIKVVEETVDGV